MSDDPQKKAFKYWFDANAARALAEQIAGVYQGFNARSFQRLALKDLESLELLARVEQFAAAMRECLPQSIPKALDIILQSLPEPMKDCDAVAEGWLQWPLGYFVGAYGLDYYEESIHAMTELTQRFSAEFAIRPFATRYTNRVYDDLLRLAQSHSSPHVRRWTCEGLRTRLPWGKRLKDLIRDPSPLWPILETLKDDPELYVRRSVANSLNDISKDHPNPVIARCNDWCKGASEERHWVIRHALRTLVKDGDAAALSVIGYRPPKGLDVSIQVSPKKVTVGDRFTLTVEILNQHSRRQRLMIDYAICFARQGNHVGTKVFKGTTHLLEPGGSVTWVKQHPMKLTTVRRLYPGKHRVTVQINGQSFAESTFQLKV